MELRLVNTPHKPVTQASERRSKKSPKTGSQWLNKPEWLEAGARREASALIYRFQSREASRQHLQETHSMTAPRGPQALLFHIRCLFEQRATADPFRLTAACPED